MVIVIVDYLSHSLYNTNSHVIVFEFSSHYSIMSLYCIRKPHKKLIITQYFCTANNFPTEKSKYIYLAE